MSKEQSPYANRDHSKTTIDKNAALQFMGQMFGEAKKMDSEIVSPTVNLTQKSGQIAKTFEKTLKVPVAKQGQKVDLAMQLIPDASALPEGEIPPVSGPEVNPEASGPNPPPVAIHPNPPPPPPPPQEENDDQLLLALDKKGTIDDVYQKLAVIEDMLWEIKKEVFRKKKNGTKDKK